MRADAKMFAEQAGLLLDQSGKSMTTLSRQSGVSRSTLYRVFFEPTKYIDRETAVKIAEGLGASIEFTGRNVRLFLENKSLRNGSQGRVVDSMSEEELELERRIKSMGNRLRNVDAATFDVAEELVNAIIAMDKEDVINIREFHRMINLGGNAAQFKRKLKALIELARPFEMEGEVKRFAEG